MKDLIERLKDVRAIATHDDVFHPDEVLACAVIYRIFRDKLDMDIRHIVRTREPEKLVKVDMRIDVGRKYSLETFDFDHHQGSEKRSNGIPYASAGLIWKNFGELLLPEQDSRTYIDHKIFQQIDAADNGFPTYIVTLKSPFTLFDAISSYNSLWQENITSQDVAFDNAMIMANGILINELLKAKRVPEYNRIVRAAIAEQKDKQYLLLEKDLPVWQPTVVRTTDMKYLVHPDESGNWRSRAVPTVINGFEPRLPFPEDWRGLSGKELQEVSGVYDAEFCHKAGFMAVAKSKKGAIALTEKSLIYQR